MSTGEHFADRLSAAIGRCNSVACVGLDPVFEKLPAAVRAAHGEPVEAIGAFAAGVLRAVAGLVPAVKFQSACYERYGWQGVRELERGIALAKTLGLVVILDAKRGDIGVSAEHYAFAAFARMGADALTVSPYMGPDTIEPFLAQVGTNAGTGVFVLARTSNPQSDALQSLSVATAGADRGVECGEGREQTLATHVGQMIARLGAGRLGACGLSDVGAVVAATKPGDAAAMRASMPDQVFLIPGYGAQGGAAQDVRDLCRAGQGGPEDVARAGVLVTASRSVIYPSAVGWGVGMGVGTGTDAWTASVRSAAERLVSELRGVFEVRT